MIFPSEDWYAWGCPESTMEVYNTNNIDSYIHALPDGDGARLIQQCRYCGRLRSSSELVCRGCGGTGGAAE